MKTTFDIHRFMLLIKRFFTENKQRELTFWGITIVVFMLMRDSGSVLSYMFIAGFFTAAYVFRIFIHTPGGMHYLLIPATHTEKLVSAIIINTVYFFLAFLATYVIGTFLGINLENLIFGHNREVTFSVFNDNFYNQLEFKKFWYFLYAFTLVQAVAITGSLYFRRSAAMKTILTIFITVFVLFLIEVLMLKVLFGTNELSQHTLNINIGPHEFKEFFPSVEIIVKILGFALVPFLWIVSYFRLTEKQV